MTSHLTKLFTAALLIAMTGALTTAQTPANLPKDVNPASLARLPYLERKNLSEADQKLYDLMPGRNTTTGMLGPSPLGFAAYNLPVAKALLDLHNAAYAGSLDARTRELAIMVACRETNYNLEWNGHEPTALRSGIDAKVLETIRNKGTLTGLPEKDATVIRFGRQLYTDRKVDSATFAKAVELFGQKGVMDMVAVMNTYAVSGFYGIAVDEHAPAGKPSF